MRYRTLFLSLLCAAATLASAQNISVFIGEPRATIGIHFASYPEFVRVPNYPVYYAPRVNYNVFFYDGLYWAYYDDRWYASSWYNGPWGIVEPVAVPVAVLRVPVRYYRQRPAYFASWSVDAAPRWDVHYGSTWVENRVDWVNWNRSAMPAAAPLPVYQRQYTGARYPATVEQQVVIQNQQYAYRPRETVVQQFYSRNGVQAVKTTTTTTTANQSTSSVAPGQVKRQQGAQSAKEFAPGQVKKEEGAQSAKAYAPGQVKKQQVVQAPAVVPQQQTVVTQAPAAARQAPAKGHRDRDGDGDVDANDHGQPQGQGHGQGKGKGHGKD